MKFDFAEKIEFLHCIEVKTDNEDLFEDVANDVAERLDMQENGAETEVHMSRIEPANRPKP